MFPAKYPMQINALFYFLAVVVAGAAVLLITRRCAASALACLATMLLAAAAIFLQMRSNILAILQLALGLAAATLAATWFRRESAARNVTSETAWTATTFSWKNILATASAATLAAIIAIAARVGTPHGLFLVPKFSPSAAQDAKATVWRSLGGDYLLPSALAMAILLIAATGYVVLATTSNRRRDAAG